MRSHRGESLARRTTGQQVQIARFQVEFVHDQLRVEFRDVLLPDPCAFVVEAVALDCELVAINRTDHAEPSVPQALSESPGTAKQVYRPQTHARRFAGVRRTPFVRSA